MHGNARQSARKEHKLKAAFTIVGAAAEPLSDASERRVYRKEGLPGRLRRPLRHWGTAVEPWAMFCRNAHLRNQLNSFHRTAPHLELRASATPRLSAFSPGYRASRGRCCGRS